MNRAQDLLRALSAVLLSSVLLAPSALAQEEELSGPPPGMYARGLFSCGEYLDGLDSGNDYVRHYMAEWVFGFMTAWQYLNKVTFYGPDEPTIRYTIEKYCRDNPTGVPFTPIMELTRQHAPEGAK